MKSLSFTIILLIVCSSFSAQNITYIDLTKAKFEEVPANRIFENIKFVPLETHKNGLLNNASYYLTDKYIIAVNFLDKAYLFDREDGRFIREVSSYGQGPDEYVGFIYPIYGFDEKNSILFANAIQLWKFINIETNKVESTIKKTTPETDNDFISANAPWLIKDNIYISYCNNRTGKDKVRLIVYDKEGNIIKKYPNYLEYKRTVSISFPSKAGIFYYYNNQTYFKEIHYNDTVFCVDEKKMTPHIIFTGDKQPSYYHQEDIGGYNKGKYLINFVYESNSFVLFNFTSTAFTKTEIMTAPTGENYYKESLNTYTGYYDKKNKQVYISITPDFKKQGYTVTGIPVNFYPISINKKNEMITRIDPAELMKFKDKVDSKYKHLIKNIQEDDNPIVVVAKLK